MKKHQSIALIQPTENDLMLINPQEIELNGSNISPIQEAILVQISDSIQNKITNNQDFHRDDFDQPYVEIICDGNKEEILKEINQLMKINFSYKWKNVKTYGILITTKHNFINENKIWLNFNILAIPIFIHSRKMLKTNIKLNNPVTQDDTLISKEELFAKIDLSLQQYAEGKFKTLEPNTDVHQFLTDLCAE
jgi:hypothetical protein